MPISRIIAAAVMFGLGSSLDAAGQEPLFDPDAPPEPLAELAGAFSCPVDKLIALYSSLAPAELPAMLAVESEVLLICAERQERLRVIMTAEVELRELMDIPPPPPGAPRVSVAGIGRAQPAGAVADRSCPASLPEASGEPKKISGTGDAGGRVAVDTLAPPMTVAPPSVPDRELNRAAKPATGDAGVLSGLLAAALTSLADRATSEAAVSARPVQACGEWSWIWTVRTSLGGQLAGLSDGSGRIYEVKEQDRLDGGLIVSRISREGVFVQDAGGRLVPLPRAAAAGSPNGAGQGEVPGEQR